MYEKSHGIFYHSAAHLEDYFYSPAIHRAAEKMSSLLRQQATIHLFSDATLKSNRFPNGMAVIQPYAETILAPSLLRDPGCGFLLFHFPTENINEAEIKHTLHAFGQRLEAEDFAMNISHDIHAILLQGMHCYDTSVYDHFAYAKFDVDEEALLIKDADIPTIIKDLSALTNTIEIKKLSQSDLHSTNTLSNYIGFIHTGSLIFPHLFNTYFFQDIADFTYYHHFASISDIRDSIYGVPLSTDLGYRYYQWLKAIMNFCLVKRWLIFTALADFMQEQLQIEIKLLNDRIHAGVFPDEKNLIQSRGVQFFQADSNPNKNYFLLAGQRETISYLLTPKPTLHSNEYLCHGTSYAHDETINYTERFDAKQAQHYLALCNEMKANTALEQDKCLAYTYNIQQQLQYFMQKEICENSFCLEPLANYFGESLIRAHYG